MPPNRTLLSLSAVTGPISVGAALLASWPTSALCGVVAPGALVGYVAVAGRRHRRGCGGR